MTDPKLTAAARLSPEWKAIRAAARRERGELVARVSAILFEADPVGISSKNNADEYDAEAETIVARLPACGDAASARKVIAAEFAAWFGPEYGELTPALRQAVNEIWQAWTHARAA